MNLFIYVNLWKHTALIYSNQSHLELRGLFLPIQLRTFTTSLVTADLVLSGVWSWFRGKIFPVRRPRAVLKEAEMGNIRRHICISHFAKSIPNPLQQIVLEIQIQWKCVHDMQVKYKFRDFKNSHVNIIQFLYYPFTTLLLHDNDYWSGDCVNDWS